MRFAEIDVVIECSSGIVRLLEHRFYSRTYSRIDGEKRTKQQGIIRLAMELSRLHAHARVILIKYVLGIVLLVEKSERQMRFHPLLSAHERIAHAIALKLIAGEVSDMVIACFCNDVAVHSGSSERDDGVKRASAGNGGLRLVIFEKDIQHGLPNANDTCHLQMKRVVSSSSR